VPWTPPYSLPRQALPFVSVYTNKAIAGRTIWEQIWQVPADFPASSRYAFDLRNRYWPWNRTDGQPYVRPNACADLSVHERKNTNNSLHLNMVYDADRMFVRSWQVLGLLMSYFVVVVQFGDPLGSWTQAQTSPAPNNYSFATTTAL